MNEINILIDQNSVFSVLSDQKKQLIIQQAITRQYQKGGVDCNRRRYLAVFVSSCERKYQCDKKLNGRTQPGCYDI